MQAEAAPAESDCVAREGIFARRAKTNLPMCLRRCESSSLGRFAERVRSWLHFAAAEVPCKTAPFASFSGRTEKEGPARPERIPISSSVVRVIKKASVTGKFYEMVLTKRYPFFDRLATRRYFTVGRCFVLSLVIFLLELLKVHIKRFGCKIRQYVFLFLRKSGNFRNHFNLLPTHPY